MQDFRNLRVWQANRQLTVAIYRATDSYPRSERYGLVDQTRRCVVSIGANIAEGCGRSTRPDTLRYFGMGFSSSTELLHHLITANDLAFLADDQFKLLDDRLLAVRKQLTSFMKRLRG